MPRVTPIQTNFTAGELSPRLYGRTDVERYRNAAAILENVWVVVQGGALGRDGLRYVAGAKHDDKHAVLIPYVFNEDQAYILEVGDAYIRFFNAAGQIVVETSPGVFTPAEIGTSYAEVDVPLLDYVQGKDTMFLFHAGYPTARLRRFGDAAWVLDPVPWITEPFDEVGHRPATTMTLSDGTVGTGRTMTAGATAFYAADVGRDVEVEGGLARITAYASGTSVTVDVLTPFATTSFASGEWTITGTPLTTCTPSVDKPVGAACTLTLGAGGWRPEDAGKFVEINSGVVRIDTISSTTVANGTITKELSATVASPALAWILKGSVWGGPFGYPRTGTLFEQRLWCGGSPGYPNTFWGSRIGEYLDYELGTNDDDAVSFIADDEKNGTILHMTAMDALVMLTNSSYLTARGGNEKPITPTNVRIKPQAGFGASTVQPERVGAELLYVQSGRKKVRGLSADKINLDQYGAPDISVLAEHIAKIGLTGMAYQEEPESIVHCTRDDGQMPTITIDRDQDIVAWCRQVTDGEIESVAGLPVPGGKQIWCIVRRTINGQTKRYIERFEPGILTDCAITGTDLTGKTVWDGLDHLEGKTVVVKGDGVALNDRVVTGGEIEVERPVKSIEIGLRYTPKVKLLRPEVFGAEGSSQSANMRVSKVVLRFQDTIGATVNGQQVMARTTGLGVLDTPPPLYSGDVEISELGWYDADADVVIEQPQPYPFHLLAVITTLTVNNG